MDKDIQSGEELRGGEDPTPKRTDIEKQKRRKKLGRKLLPSLLAGFSLPVTLFLYGPFELFAYNRAEFAFSLADFLPGCLLITLLCGAVLSAIPLFLKKKVYSMYIALLFWASVMSFVQGNYLNFGLDYLAGDGVGGGISTVTVIVNTVIWLLTLAAVIFLVLRFKQVRKKLRSVVCLGIALVLIMESAGAVAASFNDNVFGSALDKIDEQNSSVEHKMLTTENITELSDKSNIVVFVVDRFDVKYYYEALQKRPELFCELEGFTHYRNHISLYCRTYPSVVNMLTGQDHVYDRPREEHIEYSYQNAPYLEYLKEKGYSVNIYTDQFYGYTNAADMDEYTSNVTVYDDYEVTDRIALIGSIIGFSLYKYFPFALKGAFSWLSTQTFDELVEFKGSGEFEEYDVGNVSAYRYLHEKDFSIDTESKSFTFLHIDGCHLPSIRDENYNLLDEGSHDVINVMTQSFKIINRYLSEMKRLGVYEDSTIIITGDHAAAISDTKPVGGSRVTTMLVKPRGVGKGATLTSNAPTCHDDIWATIFASEGLTDHPSVKGRAVWDIGEAEERTRRYIFHRLNNGKTEVLEYEIVGDANVFSNWKLVSSTPGIGVYD